MLFPSPEQLLLWLLGTGDERNVLLAPILARRHVKDWEPLWRLAQEQRMGNRLAYILHMSGQEDKIPRDFHPSAQTERLVTFGEDSEAGRRFHVSGTVPLGRFREFEALYGAP